jgi:hypothetical protein
LKPCDWLRCPQAQEAGEIIGHSEELDADLPLGWRTCIAHQALCPREPKMRPLCSRKDCWRDMPLARQVLRKPHLDVLITHKLHAGASVLSPAPVTPEEGRTSNDEGVEQDTHLARFGAH